MLIGAGCSAMTQQANPVRRETMRRLGADGITLRFGSAERPAGFRPTPFTPLPNLLPSRGEGDRCLARRNALQAPALLPLPSKGRDGMDPSHFLNGF